MSKATILLADDDASIRLIVSQALAQEGYTVRATSNASALWKWIRDGEGDLLVTDVYMPDESIFDLLPQIRHARPNLPVIVISGHTTVMTAVSAADSGAYDYLPKPFDIDHLIETVRRALQKKPSRGIDASGKKAEKDETLPLIGRSVVMQQVYRVISRVMSTDLTVLINGQSGTGKELVARALHDLGRRAKGPFSAITLAAMPRERIETELFGQIEDGVEVAGKVKAADGGTLFLDEVGDMPLEAQTRLLRFLQDGEFTPIGGARPQKVDVRIVASTKHNLRSLIEQGLFREDLYYRLNVVSVELPPLKERKEDIPDLARAFLVRARKEGLPEKALDKSALDALAVYDWPGNVRELENIIRRVAALSPESVITGRELAQQIQPSRKLAAAEGEPDFETQIAALLQRHFADRLSNPKADLPDSSDFYEAVIAQVERPLLKMTVEATNGNKVRAAALLGLNRNTLRSKMQSLGLAGED
jgi:two-component system, NtrC family, nitrogen regulation response regulator GlnG